GSTEGLPEQLVQVLESAQRRTAANKGLHVNLAVGYGGRREIADAMRSIVHDHEQHGGTLHSLAEVLTPELIAEHLYTGGQPDPDLVIRTSGEQRLSDFMLWQSAHSEFYFVEALGPDLREVDFLRALRDFGGRQRRFGSWPRRAFLAVPLAFIRPSPEPGACRRGPDPRAVVGSELSGTAPDGTATQVRSAMDRRPSRRLDPDAAAS